MVLPDGRGTEAAEGREDRVTLRSVAPSRGVGILFVARMIKRGCVSILPFSVRLQDDGEETGVPRSRVSLTTVPTDAVHTEGVDEY